MVVIKEDMAPSVRPVKAGYWNLFRPWTLHGAVVPVLLGGAVAFTIIDLNAVNIAVFVLILIGACLFQSAANIFNTYGDYKKGTDTVENETRSPELVTGKLTTDQVRNMGILCLVLICIIGLILISHVGWGLMIYGIIGILGVTMYTLGASYKYLGLGQLSVFINFGYLMPLGTYYTLTGEIFSWDVVLLSIPNSLMITGVLAGNELRDYDEDRKHDVGTLSGHMSYDSAMILYRIESLGSFAALAVLIIAGAVPVTCALAFLTLYDGYIVYRNSMDARNDDHAGFMLVPLCFRLNWHFGVLLTAGYLIGMFIHF